MHYGLADNKRQVLLQASADIDLLKHYLSQAQKLDLLKKAIRAFEHRTGLAVELGRIVGGLIKKTTVKA